MNTHKTGEKIQFGDGFHMVAAEIININEKDKTAVVKIEDYENKNRAFKMWHPSTTQTIDLFTIHEGY